MHYTFELHSYIGESFFAQKTFFFLFLFTLARATWSGLGWTQQTQSFFRDAILLLFCSSLSIFFRARADFQFTILITANWSHALIKTVRRRTLITVDINNSVGWNNHRATPNQKGEIIMSETNFTPLLLPDSPESWSLWVVSEIALRIVEITPVRDHVWLQTEIDTVDRSEVRKNFGSVQRACAGFWEKFSASLNALQGKVDRGEVGSESCSTSESSLLWYDSLFSLLSLLQIFCV